MAVYTVAKAGSWCLNCPDTISPGDAVVIDYRFARPGDRTQPQVHERCEDLPPYDPDVDQF
ncbi:hypothetical protein [Micromonospora sp. NPDC049891]|uniref:hypothetical protein n=1 Tax=Micromonospora sp. NPDC049891 TaxID=3155655 RepID=UPI0033F3FA2D